MRLGVRRSQTYPPSRVVESGNKLNKLRALQTLRAQPRRKIFAAREQLMVLLLRAGISGNQNISFVDIAELPAWNQISDAAVLLYFHCPRFANETAISGDEQFTPLHHALIFTGIDDNEVPFLITYKDFAP